jgi:hypothetical protein
MVFAAAGALHKFNGKTVGVSVSQLLAAETAIAPPPTPTVTVMVFVFAPLVIVHPPGTSHKNSVAPALEVE